MTVTNAATGERWQTIPGRGAATCRVSLRRRPVLDRSARHRVHRRAGDRRSRSPWASGTGSISPCGAGRELPSSRSPRERSAIEPGADRAGPDDPAPLVSQLPLRSRIFLGSSALASSGPDPRRRRLDRRAVRPAQRVPDRRRQQLGPGGHLRPVAASARRAPPAGFGPCRSRPCRSCRS